MLARIQTLSDDHFDTDLDAIHWGDVGTLTTIPACCARSPTSPSARANVPSDTEAPPSKPRKGGAYLRRRERKTRARPRRYRCPTRPCCTNWRPT
jgi:hypothetical protein